MDPQYMTCQVCYRPFNQTDRRPYNICNESHTFCQQCLNIIKNSENRTCPMCHGELNPRLNRTILDILSAPPQPRHQQLIPPPVEVVPPPAQQLIPHPDQDQVIQFPPVRQLIPPPKEVVPPPRPSKAQKKPISYLTRDSLKDSFWILYFTILIALSTFWGFGYLNSYFIYDLYKVVISKTNTTEGIAPINCLDYYCDYSPHYYIHNYASFTKCNKPMCSPICSNFDCSVPPISNSTYYYNCFTSCQSFSLYSQKPTLVIATFYVACAGGGIFVSSVLLLFVYGIVVECTSLKLGCWERVGLLINFVCPMAKYYTFRLRRDWRGVRVNLVKMLKVDEVVVGMMAVAMMCYWFLAFMKVFMYYTEYMVVYGITFMVMAYGENIRRNKTEILDFVNRISSSKYEEQQ